MGRGERHVLFSHRRPTLGGEESRGLANMFYKAPGRRTATSGSRRWRSPAVLARVLCTA